jgi:hypothetical protein
VATPEALSSAPLLILSASVAVDAQVVEVGRQDDRLGLQRRVRALDQPDDVAALALLDLGLQLDGDLNGRAKPLTRPSGVSAAASTASRLVGRAGEQLGAALQAQAGQARRLGAAHIGHALGVAPGHPPFLIAATPRANGRRFS